jgi:hypothetical protein
MEILYRLSGFRGEDLLEIDQPETRIAYAYDEMSNLYRGSWQGDLKILHKA